MKRREESQKRKSKKRREEQKKIEKEKVRENKKEEDAGPRKGRKVAKLCVCP